MAGTYILTDTINHAFAEVFGIAYANKAVVVTDKETLGRGTGSEVSVLNAATLARVRAVPGVAAASGSIWTRAAILTTSGKRLTSGGAPALVNAVQPPRFESFTAAEGQLPTAADQVAIDQATADRDHLKLGQQIVIAGRSPARRYTISGIAKFAGSESFGGASVVLLVPQQAQYVAGEPGAFDGINVANSPGVSSRELRAHASARRCRATLTVRTGAQEAANADLRTRRTARLPAHLPADLRVRRAVRRRIHHLQHLLDHRRPAHARVRSAAHARRLARADHALGGRGRPAAGHRRCGDRPVRGDRPGAGAGRAVQGVRRGSAGQRHGPGDAHRDRLAAAWALS